MATAIRAWLISPWPRLSQGLSLGRRRPAARSDADLIPAWDGGADHELIPD